MHPRVSTFREKSPSKEEDILKLQKEVQDLRENSLHLQRKLESTTTDLTDIVVYLKNTIEEKDEDIARLEEVLSLQDKTKREAIQKEKSENEEKMRLLEEEREGLKTQVNMISTQLSSQARILLEMEDMRAEIGSLKELVEEQRSIIDQKENNERRVKILTTEIVRQEMSDELNQEISNAKEQLQLEREAQLLMNQRVIEHLQKELLKVHEESRISKGKLDETGTFLEAEKEAKLAVEKERDTLRRLVERSGATTEKTVKDMRKRVQDAENKRQKAALEQMDTAEKLTKQISELRDLLQNSNRRCDRLEKNLLREKELRTATVTAHSSQNAKIAELKDFLAACLSGHPSADQVLGESRVAIFGQLSLIVSQIPTVQ